MKSRNAKGMHHTIGFCWVGGELKWSEQGLIVG